jgi:shikimate dehydrogenase
MTLLRACVIGWPIKHSRSPLIHGYWLQHYGIEGSYTREAVPPEELATFIATLGGRGFRGCNVTVPHKEAVCELVTDLTEAARAVGAVNTVWLEQDRIRATNTDIEGFMANLVQLAPDWNTKGRPVVVLGAGGAARGIVFGLLQAGAHEIRIANRTRERAEALVERFGRPTLAIDWADREAALADAGLLVNTTVLGMSGSDCLMLALDRLAADAVVADIVYVPLETPLLAEARRRGHRTVDGLGMLLHQAVGGFEKWFGVRPEVTAELRALVVADIEGR